MRRPSLLKRGKGATDALALVGRRIFMKAGLMGVTEVMEAAYILK